MISVTRLRSLFNSCFLLFSSPGLTSTKDGVEMTQALLLLKTVLFWLKISHVFNCTTASIIQILPAFFFTNYLSVEVHRTRNSMKTAPISSRQNYGFSLPDTSLPQLAIRSLKSWAEKEKLAAEPAARQKDRQPNPRASLSRTRQQNYGDHLRNAIAWKWEGCDGRELALLVAHRGLKERAACCLPKSYMSSSNPTRQWITKKQLKRGCRKLERLKKDERNVFFAIDYSVRMICIEDASELLIFIF